MVVGERRFRQRIYDRLLTEVLILCATGWHYPARSIGCLIAASSLSAKIIACSSPRTGCQTRWGGFLIRIGASACLVGSISTPTRNFSAITGSKFSRGDSTTPQE